MIIEDTIIRIKSTTHMPSGIEARTTAPRGIKAGTTEPRGQIVEAMIVHTAMFIVDPAIIPK
jgi:hypothetical protein